MNQNFYLVYSKDYVPERVHNKIWNILGDRAIGLTGEWKIGAEDKHYRANANVSFRFNPNIISVLKKLKPDVIIGDGFFKWTFASVFYKLLYRTPLVICYEKTFHSERNVQWYRTLFRRMVVKIADAMCCNGKLCGEYSRYLGMPADKITYGHMAADIDQFIKLADNITRMKTDKIREKFKLKGIVFLYVGRLIELKGLEELLNAWIKSKLKSSQATLFFIGGGIEMDSLKKFCSINGLDNVCFAGAADYDGIAEYYASTDVFIMPTLEDNWSLVVPEAMACGLPILCSKYNGCWPEMIEEGVNGWVFDPLVIDDISEKILLAYGQKDKFKEMGTRSKEIVGIYGPDKAAQSICDACKIVLRK